MRTGPCTRLAGVALAVCSTFLPETRKPARGGCRNDVPDLQLAARWLLAAGGGSAVITRRLPSARGALGFGNRVVRRVEQDKNTQLSEADRVQNYSPRSRGV